jgi:hypothetical protein
LNTHEIINELTRNDLVFPKQAIAEAVEQREAITPELLHILESAKSLDWASADYSHYTGHIYAMYLLAQFREQQAYPILIDLISSDQEMVDRALGDIITESLGRMLASVYDGDMEPIYRVIENPGLNEYVRGAAIRAIVILVARGVKTREEAMTYFHTLFNGKLERKHSDVWASLVDSCNEMYPEDLIDDIKKAYSDGFVSGFYTGWEETEYKLRLGKDHTLASLTSDSHYKFIEDTDKELSGW